MQENIWLQLPSVSPAHSPPILISNGLNGRVRGRLKSFHPLYIMMKMWNHCTCSHIHRALHLDTNRSLSHPLGEEGIISCIFQNREHFSSCPAPRWHRQAPVISPLPILAKVCSYESTRGTDKYSWAVHAHFKVAPQQFRRLVNLKQTHVHAVCTM